VGPKPRGIRLCIQFQPTEKEEGHELEKDFPPSDCAFSDPLETLDSAFVGW
jgi:hypothetical protein